MNIQEFKNHFDSIIKNLTKTTYYSHQLIKALRIYKNDDSLSLYDVNEEFIEMVSDDEFAISCGLDPETDGNRRSLMIHEIDNIFKQTFDIVAENPQLLETWISYQSLYKKPKDYILSRFSSSSNSYDNDTFENVDTFFKNVNLLIENKTINSLFDLIPSEYKKVDKIKNFEIIFDPTNDVMYKLFYNLLDDCNHYSDKINFLEEGVVVCNGHHLTFIKDKNDALFDDVKITGVFNENKELTDINYPNYKFVIPKSYYNVITLEVDQVLKLYEMLSILIKSNLVKNVYNYISIFNGVSYNQYNAIFLKELLKVWLTMNNFNKLEFGFKDENINSPMYFSPNLEKFSKNLSSGSVLQHIAFSKLKIWIDLQKVELKF